MPDAINEGHDARLACPEEETRYLRVGFDEVRQSLKEMAQAVIDLAKEAAPREADRESFRRIFAQLEVDCDEFTHLWHGTDEMIEKAADLEKKRLEAELNARHIAAENRQIGNVYPDGAGIDAEHPCGSGPAVGCALCVY